MNCFISIVYRKCIAIIQLCKHVVAKVTLVPCSVNLTGKRDTVGHGEVTINNARIIRTGFCTLNFDLFLLSDRFSMSAMDIVDVK